MQSREIMMIDLAILNQRIQTCTAIILMICPCTVILSVNNRLVINLNHMGQGHMVDLVVVMYPSVWCSP